MTTILPRHPPFTERDLLLAELSHRINNEFTCAIATVSLVAARSENKEVKATLAVVSDRLLAHASLHRVLQMPAQGAEVDASAYIRQLCEAISQSKLVDKNIRLALVDHPLKMDAARCWRLGLIVCELITNAVRHAFDDVGGAIRVELLSSLPFVECRVSDNGRAAKPIRPGRGLRIVQALAGTLGGTIDYIVGENGSTAVLIFPERINARPERRASVDISAAEMP